MYPAYTDVEKKGKSGKSPYVMCEYDHSMGNSTGALKDYWDIIRKYPNLQGGWIWDWADQSINTQIPGAEPSETYWAYDGDWDVYTGKNNFCVNGIIAPDRTIHPAMYEVKKVYQSFQMTAKDLEAGVITIDNEYIDTNANEYDMTWELIRDGESIASHTQSVDVPPQETVDITLEGYTAPVDLQPGEECYPFHYKRRLLAGGCRRLYQVLAGLPHSMGCVYSTSLFLRTHQTNCQAGFYKRY